MRQHARLCLPNNTMRAAAHFPAWAVGAGGPPTSNVNLLPTLLDAMDGEIPDWCEGQVLPRSREGGSGRNVFAIEARHNLAHQLLRLGTVTLIVERHKPIHDPGDTGLEDAYEPYDLWNDPEEPEDRCGMDTTFASELRRELDQKVHQASQPYEG